MAFVMANEFVKRELKAPATAVFPSITDSGVLVTRTPSRTGKQCAFRVLTFVDAQNSFGAQLRSGFVVQVAPDDQSGREWTLERITPLN